MCDVDCTLRITLSYNIELNHTWKMISDAYKEKQGMNFWRSPTMFILLQVPM
jgi:hypothetical protein